MEKCKGMPNSAGGGEAPDWPAEDVMSRPAREALPQLPPPAVPPPPQVVPLPWVLGWEGLSALGNPRLGLCTPCSPSLHPGDEAHRVG